MKQSTKSKLLGGVQMHWGGRAGRRPVLDPSRHRHLADTGHTARSDFEALEPRILLSADVMPFVVDLDAFGDDLILSYDVADALDPLDLDAYEIHDAATGSLVGTIDAGSGPAFEFRSGNANTKLTVDLIEPFDGSVPIHFSLGGGADTLTFSGARFDSVDVQFSGAGAGAASFEFLTQSGALEMTSFDFDGVEEIDLSADIDAFILRSTSGDDAATLSRSGDRLQFDSATLPGLTLDLPSADISINLGEGDDTLTVGALGNLDGALSISGEAGFDTVAVDSLATNGSALFLSAEDATVNGGAVISTTTGGVSAGDVTFDVTSLMMGPGAQLLAADFDGANGGAITITATDALDAPDAPGLFDANASVVIDGAVIRAATLDITSDGSITTGPTPSVSTAEFDLLDFNLEAALTDTQTLTLQSSVSILGGSDILVDGNANILATGALTADTTLVTDLAGRFLSDVDVDVLLDVAGTTRIEAGGDLSMKAELTPSLLNTQNDGTFNGVITIQESVTLLDVDVSATTGAATTLIAGGDVSLEAASDIDLRTTAQPTIVPTLFNGSSFAQSFVDIDVLAQSLGDVTAGGAMAVDATSNLKHFVVADNSPLARTILAKGASAINSSPIVPFDVAGTFAYQQDANDATARIGGGDIEAGSVLVNAHAETQATNRAGSSNDGSAGAVNVAIAIADSDINALAEIDGGAVITAGGLVDVSALMAAPISDLDNVGDTIVDVFSALGSGFLDVLEGLEDVFTEFSFDKFDDLQFDVDLVPLLSIFTSRVSAGTNAGGSAGGSGTLALSGAASIQDLDTSSIARIGDATIVASDVEVDADGEVVNFHLMYGSSSGYIASGLSLLFVDSGSTIVAHIDDGADITTTGDVTVTADLDEFFLGLANRGGGGAGYSGTGSSIDLERDAVVGAIVEEGAQIDANGALTVAADENLDAILGIFANSASTAGGIGASVSVADIDGTIFAGIGDLDTSMPDDADLFARMGGATDGTGAATAGGLITAGAVDVAATTGEFADDDLAGNILGNSVWTIAYAGSTPEKVKATKTSGASGAKSSPVNSGKGSAGLGASAAVSITDIDTDVRAWIGDGVTIEASDLGLDAISDRDSRSFALGRATAGTATIGGAFASSTQGGTTSALIEGATLIINDASVGGFGVPTSLNTTTLNAQTLGDIVSISAGIGTSAKSGLAGSVSFNTLASVTEAGLIGTTLSTDTLSVTANNGATADAATGEGSRRIFAIAGASATGAGFGTGASVAIQNTQDQTRAFVESLSDPNLDTLDIAAATDLEIFSFANSIGSGGSGFSGSSTSNVVENVTEAYIRNSELGTTSSLLSVGLSAFDKSLVVTEAGGGAKGGGLSIGASVVHNKIASEVHAFVDENSILTVVGDVDIRAETDIDLYSFSIAGGVSSGFVGAGAVGVNFFGNVAEASVSGGAIRADGNVALVATQDGLFTPTAGAFGFGSGTTIGGGVLVNTSANRTEALVTGATIDAFGFGAAIDVPTGERDGSGVPLQDSVSGLALIAAARTGINPITANLAVTNGAGIGITANTTTVRDETRAKIEGAAQIGTQSGASNAQSVLVRADHTTEMLAIGGGISAGSGAGIGASGDYLRLKPVTEALVDGGSVVAAADSVELDANGRMIVDSSAFSGAGSAGFAAGVAGSVLNIDATVRAKVGDADIDAGNDLIVDANSDTDILQIVATATGTTGAAAGSLGIAYAEITNTTEAEISGDATTDASGATRVEAGSDTEFLGVAAGLNIGAVGGFGGSFAMKTVDGTTSALIGGGAQVNQNVNGASVDVIAGDVTKTNSFLGEVAVGVSAGGIGAVVDVQTIRPNVRAEIGAGANVQAQGDITLDASSALTAESRGIAIAGGPVFGGAAAVSVVSIGSQVEQESLTSGGSIGILGVLDDAQSTSDGTAFVDTNSGNVQTDSIASEGQAEATTSQSEAEGDEKLTAVDDGSFGNTEAIVGAGATVTGGGLNALAHSTATAFTDLGTLAGSGTISIGGAVGHTTVQHGARALVDAGAVVDVTGDVDIDATTFETITGFAASAAVSGVGTGSGSFLFTKVNTATDARVAAGASVSGADISVDADNTSLLTNIAGELSASGTVSIGATGVDANFAKTTTAVIDAATVDASGDVSVTASASEGAALGDVLITAATLGGSGGVDARGMGFGLYTANVTEALIADGAFVTAGNTVGVEARHDISGLAIAGGGSFSGVGGLLFGLGIADFADKTLATIGDATVTASGQGTSVARDRGDRAGATEDSSGVSVAALSSIDVLGDVAGITVGLGGTGDAAALIVESAVETTASIADGATISGPDLQLRSAHLADIDGGAQTLGFGLFLSLGGSVDTRVSENNVVAQLGGAVFTGGSAAVSAQSDESQSSFTFRAGGGIAAGGVSTTNADLRSSTSAIALGADVNATGDVVIEATSLATTTLTAGSAGGAVGGLGGALVGHSEAGETTATLSGGSFETAGDVLVDASSTRTAILQAVSAQFAIGGFSGATVESADAGRTEGRIDGPATIDGASLVGVEAATNATIDADVVIGSLSLVGGSAMGVSVTTDGASGPLSTRAAVEDGAVFGQSSPIGSLDIAASTVMNVTADGVAVGGALVGVGGGGAGVDLAPETEAYLGDVDITATGDVRVAADADISGTVNLDGYSIGVLDVQISLASADVQPVVSAEIAAGALINAGNLEVHAEGKGDAEANASSFQIGAISGNILNTEAIGGADVSANIASSSANLTQIDVTGDVAVTAIANGDADADTKGQSYALVGIGFTKAISSLFNTAMAKLGGTIRAGEGLALRALSNVDETTGQTTGDGSTAASRGANNTLAGGSSRAVAEADATVDVDVEIDAGSDIVAGSLMLDADGAADTKATATASSEGLILSLATPSAESVLDNRADATIGAGSTIITSGDLAVSSRATSNMDVVAIAGSAGGASDENDVSGDSSFISVVGLGGAGAKGEMNSKAKTTVGDDTALVAGENLGLFATNVVDASVFAENDQGDLTSVFSDDLLGASFANATLIMDADAAVSVGDDVILTGDTVTLAALNQIDGIANARAVGVGTISSTAFANAFLLAPNGEQATASVEFGDRTEITADEVYMSALNLTDDVALLAKSFARYDNNLAGYAGAFSTGDLEVDASVIGGLDTSISTSFLEVTADSEVGLDRPADVEADGGVSKIVEFVVRVTETFERRVCKWLPWPLDKICSTVTKTIVKFVTKTKEVFEAATSDSDQFGRGAVESGRIILNGDIQNTGAGGRFVEIGETGALPGSDVGVTLVDGQWVLDDIVSAVSPTFIFSTPDGNIGGTATLDVAKTIPRVEIINRTDRDVVLGRVDMITPDEADSFDVGYDAQNTFEYDFRDEIEKTELIILNEGAGDIILTQSISSPTAEIEITNTGGSLRTATPDVGIVSGDAGHLKIDVAGDVGDASDNFDVRLVSSKFLPDGTPSDRPAELIVFAHDAYVDLVAVNTTGFGNTATDPVDGVAVTMVTEGDAVLRVTDSLLQSSIAGADEAIETPAAGTISVLGLTSATGDVTVTALAAGVSFDLGLSQVWTEWEATNAGLIAAGLEGVITAAGVVRVDITGALRDQNGDARTDILANEIAIAAAEVDSLEVDAVAGVSASIIGDGKITETAGNLNADGIAAGGDLELVSSEGAIRGIAASGADVSATNADLQAATDIGAADDPLNTGVLRLVANAGSGGITMTNDGALQIDAANAPGDVRIVAQSPLVVAGSVTGASVVLTATDGAGAGDIITVIGQILATVDVTLTGGDGVLIAPTAIITAPNTVTIRNDDSDGIAGVMLIDGTITAVSVAVEGSDVDDVIAIRKIVSQTTVDAGDGADTIRVGSLADGSGAAGSLLSDIGATLTINGDADDDRVEINATGDATGLSGQIDSAGVSGFGLADRVDVNGIEALELALGDGGESLAITGTIGGTTKVSAGGGDDEITITAISGDTEILGETGDDTLTVGDVTLGLAGIAATLRFDGADGIDGLTLDDSAASTDRLGTIETDAVTGFGMAADASVDNSNIESLDLTLGSGNDRVNVRGAAVATSVQTGAGDDIIHVSSQADLAALDGLGPDASLEDIQAATLAGTLDSVTADLAIDAGTGSNTLGVSDRDATIGDTATLSADALTGLAEGQIDFAATGGDFGGAGLSTWVADRGVNIFGGAGDNDWTVTGLANGFVTLFTGAGKDSASVAVGAGTLELRAETGDDTIDASASTTGLALIGGQGDDDILGGSAADVLLGDDGTIGYDTRAVTSIDVDASAGGDDLIRAGAGNDIVIGGAGDDTIGGDTGRDLLIGDGASLAAKSDNTDPRLRQLSGPTLYGAPGTANDGQVMADAAGQLDPNGLAAWSGVDIDLIIAASDGADAIGGGADGDMIFGGGGADALRGDADIDGAGDFVVTAHAGKDYIEGNLGDDTIHGGLGQDDLVGGSSTLFGLDQRIERQDGSDLIFGGTGTKITRNDAGDTGANANAADADVIAGDNANIFRLVAADGTPLSFNYDAGLDVRAVRFVDYTPGGVTPEGTLALGDAGAGDRIHGEAGADQIYGMTGGDDLFGDGQDDDLIGGRGHDVIYGGTGIDGILGDDGRILTMRNSTTVAEELFGLAPLDATDRTISTPGKHHSSLVDEDGAITKIADLTPFDPLNEVVPGVTLDLPIEADDVIFGGLGDDFLHGGHGDDAISGAEARIALYGTIINPGDLLQFGFDRGGEFGSYDEFDPLERIDGFLLNPEDTTFDGDDAIFGDIGNDWIFGGTGSDRMFGGHGDDLIDADDDKSTNGGANDSTDADSFADIAFGGAGRDVLIANTSSDRLIDWVGQFNSYIRPDDLTGGTVISRAPQPAMFDYIAELGRAEGADRTRFVDGGDPERGGEPYGELGIVTQRDAEFRDQTGAPQSPLLGEIPDGAREALSVATFNDGSADNFAADSGTWETDLGRFAVAPEVLGGDAVSIQHLEFALPGYFEVTATVNTGKSGAGLDANAYLIFDYHSPTDFKFAGINGKTNKIELGHRTTDGWIIDVQTPEQIKSNQSYNILLSVNGNSASMVVDGQSILTHEFAPHIFDGIEYGLNAGMVGIGANNSEGYFDNVAVQILPPEFTYTAEHDLTSGVPLGLSGDGWSTGANGYEVTATGTPAIALIDLGAVLGMPGAFSHEVGSALELTTQVSGTGEGGFVFDHYAADDYKFASLDASGLLVIGHVTPDGGREIDASVLLPTGADAELTLSLRGSEATLFVNGAKALVFAYNAVTVDGDFGLLAADGTTTFASLEVRTSDPAFAETMLAVGQGSGAEAITAADAQALLDDAAARLALSTGVSVDVDNTNIRVKDLGGLVLGYVDEDGTIVLDDDAAGHGWFIDETPDTDEEFTGAPSDATGSIDLLSVLAHEVGHIGGLDHAETGPMQLALATGLRLVGGSEAPAEETLVWNDELGDFVTREDDALLTTTESSRVKKARGGNTAFAAE